MASVFIPAAEITGTAPFILALSGLSGSGKTYSALLLAHQVAAGKVVCVIDTENGRIAGYKDQRAYPELHPFSAAILAPPFTGIRLMEMIDIAVQEGAGCIIVDSASDEWEGPGGVLQTHDEEIDRMAGDDYQKRLNMNMPAWAAAKRPHILFHTALLRISVPLIVCFRARPKIEIKHGKIIDKGIQPICDSRMVFDFKFHLLMDEEKRDGSYTILKSGYKHERHVFPPNGKVDAAAIDRLSKLLSPDAPSASPPAKTPKGPEWDLTNDGSHVYECVIGNPDSVAAKRALFAKLKANFTLRPMSEREVHITKSIAKANTALVDTLPEKGRDTIRDMIEVFYQAQETGND